MRVKDIKFEEFSYTKNLLVSVKHYNNGKIKAKMQLALCKLKNNSYFFNVSIDIYEGKDNNRWGKQVGQQYANLSLDGDYFKKLNPSSDYIPNTFSNEKSIIDKKFMPWVLSAMEFMKELTQYEI